LVIWGTSVSATEFRAKFQRFIKMFKEENADEDEVMMDNYHPNQPFYMQKLEEVSVKGNSTFNLARRK
jgi:hypothetical protein